MAHLLLGIDLGTSACKVALFEQNGDLVASRTKEYKVYYPKPGYAEQNPDEWWEAICAAISEMLREDHIDARDIAGVGMDGQSWSAIPVDKEGRVLYNTPIWMDMRATDICNRLNEELGKDTIFSLVGNGLQPPYSTAKILWYKENEPEVYNNTYKILQSNSFIGLRLTGEFTQDLSQGYGLHCFNMRTGEWDLDMCEKMGIDPQFLPPIFACHDVIGAVSEKAAKETGLAAGTPVVAGGLDAACGTLGAGVIKAGETQEQGGQAGGMSIAIDNYLADERLILSHHVVPNLWLLQGGTTGGGGVMRWLEKEFGHIERLLEEGGGKKSLVQLDELAKAVSAGSDGLVFLPYMSGERSPIWDAHAKGVYYGLDFSKTKGHFIRSAMEGVAFSLRHNLEVAEQAGAKVTELRAMGGAANSRLWTGMKANITGKRIVVPSADTATTLGAAILAGVGTKMYASFEEACAKTVQIKRIHEVDLLDKDVYDYNYETYLTLYNQLKDLMKRGGITK